MGESQSSPHWVAHDRRFGYDTTIRQVAKRRRCLARNVLLTCCLYTAEDPDSQQHHGTDGDPVRGHVHQSRTVNEAADHDREADCV